MKRVLIVAPHFPPVDSPDGHRARLILPYLKSFGWDAAVLAVKPGFGEFGQEPLLEATLPADLMVRRTGAFNSSWTKKLGIGSLGFRSLPHLLRGGSEMIRAWRPDLIYFATTVFPCMALGRVWRWRFDVPYVADLQDLWVSDYRKANPLAAGTRHAASLRIQQALERWTMRRAAGLVAVSGAYIETMRERYRWLREVPAETLPFGGEARDFELVRKHAADNRFFRKGDGLLHGVYAGRAGADMHTALRTILTALRAGLGEQPQLFGRIRLHFVGTDYAPAGRERWWVRPLAEELGVASQVEEHPLRISYMETLRLLDDADFLLVPGSDDPQYTASKIFPYILAEKPLLALFQPTSSVWCILTETEAGKVLEPGVDAGEFLRHWAALLLPEAARGYRREAFAAYTAEAMARRHVTLFEKVLQRERRA